MSIQLNSGKEIYQQVVEFKSNKITCEELDKNKDNYNIVDVRTVKEFKNHHMPNATSIPLVSPEEHHDVGLSSQSKSSQKPDPLRGRL